MYLVVSTHAGNPPGITFVAGRNRAQADQVFYKVCQTELGKYTDGVFLVEVVEDDSTELLRSIYCSDGGYLYDPDSRQDFSMVDDDRDSEEFRRFILQEDTS